MLARAHHCFGQQGAEGPHRGRPQDRAVAGRGGASSLELGIDTGAVDLVIEVEAPPSVASGLQRVGRAGHQVGAVSTGVVLPKNRSDLLSSAVVVQRMRSGAIEELRIANSLDGGRKSIVACVAMDDWPAADLLALFVGPHPSPSSHPRAWTKQWSRCWPAATRQTPSLSCAPGSSGTADDLRMACSAPRVGGDLRGDDSRPRPVRRPHRGGGRVGSSMRRWSTSSVLATSSPWGPAAGRSSRSPTTGSTSCRPVVCGTAALLAGRQPGPPRAGPCHREVHPACVRDACRPGSRAPGRVRPGCLGGDEPGGVPG